MSELGSLSQCMVDSDSETVTRARRLRRKALVLSLFLEAVILAGMLIWPLITPGVLPAMYIVTPLPPYRGGGGPRNASAEPARTRTRIPRRIIRDHRWFTAPHPERAARQVADENAPNIDSSAGGGPGIGGGSGPGEAIIPGGIVGPRIEPPRGPAAAAPPVRQRLSAGVMAGALIHRVDPVYPTLARAMHLAGEVRLRAIIATDGTVQHLEILSGSPILARAAENAVRQWRYRPTLLSGTPVEVETFITVNFVLDQ